MFTSSIAWPVTMWRCIASITVTLTQVIAHLTQTTSTSLCGISYYKLTELRFLLLRPTQHKKIHYCGDVLLSQLPKCPFALGNIDLI